MSNIVQNAGIASMGNGEFDLDLDLNPSFDLTHTIPDLRMEMIKRYMNADQAYRHIRNRLVQMAVEKFEYELNLHLDKQKRKRDEAEARARQTHTDV